MSPLCSASAAATSLLDEHRLQPGLGAAARGHALREAVHHLLLPRGQRGRRRRPRPPQPHHLGPRDGPGRGAQGREAAGPVQDAQAAQYRLRGDALRRRRDGPLRRGPPVAHRLHPLRRDELDVVRPARRRPEQAGAAPPRPRRPAPPRDGPRASQDWLWTGISLILSVPASAAWTSEVTFVLFMRYKQTDNVVVSRSYLARLEARLDDARRLGFLDEIPP